MRGYLWTCLQAEIADEFSSFGMTYGVVLSEVPQEMTDWFIEKPSRGLRPVGKQKTTTQSVRELRTRRKSRGECIDCGRIRHPRSKSYCAKHREADRKRAEAKRLKRRKAS